MSKIWVFNHTEFKHTLKNSLEIKIIEKLEIIFITRVNIEAQPIVFVI